MDLIEITVGAIGRAHGVRGEVAVILRTDEPERRLAPGQVLRGDNGGTFTVVRTREHQGRWLVTFTELGDRTAAEAARGVQLVADVPPDERPGDDEEYYDRQLVGLTAIVDGESYGSVRAVLHLPAQDLLEIATADGVRLVPFVSELVPEVDLENSRLVINPVAGLLDDEAELATDRSEQQR
ncbi:ribosome maturation factor RimM [Microlunatus soli]|uniref:Ribosome maturation factor RimM n=1 Tax=Microlunatus soli TaxID=630515 RepID=A0A1H1NIJ8_9ACTN|nr:ribosome maturation factor RimM [Microlunatus soli]SDR98768.1 16S rRNA processing protein RimM [Microlunatus soli]